MLLGSRHFLDLPVLITFFCVTTVTGSLVQGAPNMTIDYDSLGRVTLVAFAITATLVAVRFLVNILPNTTPSPLAVAVLFATTAIVRFEWIKSLRATPDSRVANPWTGPISVLQMFVALSTAAIVTALIAEFREQFAAAQSSQAQLMLLAATMQERVDNARRELIDKTRAQLEPMMQSLRTQFSAISESGQRALKITELLSTAVTELVRPMSHNLANEKLHVPIDLEPATRAVKTLWAELGAVIFWLELAEHCDSGTTLCCRVVVQNVPGFLAALGLILVEESNQVFGFGAHLLQRENVGLRLVNPRRHAVAKGSAHAVDVYRNNFEGHSRKSNLALQLDCSYEAQSGQCRPPRFRSFRCDLSNLSRPFCPRRERAGRS